MRKSAFYFCLGIGIMLAGIFESSGQMTYIGLKSESNVREAQIQLGNTGAYWPETQIINGYMYVPTINGIYRKDLNIVSDTLWNLYAFPGVPVRDFVKNYDSILAITAKSQDSLLLLSIDDGFTYINYTSSYFFNWETTNTIWRICNNPLDPRSVIALHNAYGVSRSSDFGNTWSDLNLWGGGYQEWFVGINPNDTTNIFYTGETMVFDSYIQGSYNSGQNWSLVQSVPNHCIHHIAFNPENPDVMLSGGEGFLRKSEDRGLTWNIVGLTSLYVFKIIYHETDTNILYASGDYHGNNDTLKIYRSVNGGNSWNNFYSEAIFNSDGILDLQMHQGKLFIFTLTNGVYMLDPLLVADDEINGKKNVWVFPNPVSDILTIQLKGNVSETAEIVLYDLASCKLFQQQFSESCRLNTAFLAKGIYIYEVRNKHGIIKKGKIVKS